MYKRQATSGEQEKHEDHELIYMEQKGVMEKKHVEEPEEHAEQEKQREQEENAEQEERRRQDEQGPELGVVDKRH